MVMLVEQVKRSAVRGCVMVLSALQSRSARESDERVSCLDVKKARRLVNRAIRSSIDSPVIPPCNTFICTRLLEIRSSLPSALLGKGLNTKEAVKEPHVFVCDESTYKTA